MFTSALTLRSDTHVTCDKMHITSSFDTSPQILPTPDASLHNCTGLVCVGNEGVDWSCQPHIEGSSISLGMSCGCCIQASRFTTQDFTIKKMWDYRMRSLGFILTTACSATAQIRQNISVFFIIISSSTPPLYFHLSRHLWDMFHVSSSHTIPLPITSPLADSSLSLPISSSHTIPLSLSAH